MAGCEFLIPPMIHNCLRSWMFVEDCCRGIRMCTERGRIGEIYNLGTHFELTIAELAQKIYEQVKMTVNNNTVTCKLCRLNKSV